MGGTSTDVATIVDGQPQWTTSGVIDGLPIGLPAFDIVTVGAGGGSVAYLDAGGALRVGPRSAGASPAPPATAAAAPSRPSPTPISSSAASSPTTSSAATMRVDPALARRAIEPLAAAMGKTVEAAALGIVRVAEHEHGPRGRRRHQPARPRPAPLHPRQLRRRRRPARLRRGRVASKSPACSSRRTAACSAPWAWSSPRLSPTCRKRSLHLGATLDDARLAAEFGYLNVQAVDRVPVDQTAAVEAYADVPLPRPVARAEGPRLPPDVGVDRGNLPRGLRVSLRPRPRGSADRDRHAPPPQARAKTASRVARTAARRVGRCVGRHRFDRLRRTAAESPRGGRGVLTGSTAPGPLLLIDPEATAYVPPGCAHDRKARRGDRVDAGGAVASRCKTGGRSRHDGSHIDPA